MRITEEEIPMIGSYWNDTKGKRFRVMMATNLRAKKAEFENYPILVVYRDANNYIWSQPLDVFKSNFTLIPPIEV